MYILYTRLHHHVSITSLKPYILIKYRAPEAVTWITAVTGLILAIPNTTLALLNYINTRKDKATSTKNSDRLDKLEERQRDFINRCDKLESENAELKNKVRELEKRQEEDIIGLSQDIKYWMAGYINEGL